MISLGLISERYVDDGIALVALNEIQATFIKKFTADERIKRSQLEECPLCQFQNFTLIAAKDRYGIPLKTVVCEKCGLIFTLDVMTNDATQIFYSEYYRKIYEGQEFPSTEILDQKYKERSIGVIPKFLNRDSTVVEIGAGGGWNLMKFKKYGYKHYGFDYDESYLDFGKKNYGLNLLLGGVEKAQELSLRADYVLVLEVLEHTIAPTAFLTQLRSITNEGGIIRLKVPSASCLISLGGGDIGYDLLGALQNAHSFLFDQFTLRYLCLKARYHVSSIFAGNAVLKNVAPDGELLERIERGLETDHRGWHVIRYLRLCEKLIGIKNRLIPKNMALHLYPICYLRNPGQLLKAILTYRLGVQF